MHVKFLWRADRALSGMIDWKMRHKGRCENGVDVDEEIADVGRPIVLNGAHGSIHQVMEFFRGEGGHCRALPYFGRWEALG